MITYAAESPIGLGMVDRVNVFVAAEDPAIRERISTALADQPDLDLAGEGSAARLLGQDSICDLVVAHCELIQPPEAALFGQLRAKYPHLRLVAVCESANGRSTRRAIDGAVDGLVFTDDLDVALAPTVAAVLAGQTVFPRGLRASLRKAALSYREKQILSLVVMGFTNSEIGSRLYLAESTVKSHLSSAFSKLGVKSRSEAAAIILDRQASLGAGIVAAAPGFDPASSGPVELTALRERA